MVIGDLAVRWPTVAAAEGGGGGGAAGGNGSPVDDGVTNGGIAAGVVEAGDGVLLVSHQAKRTDGGVSLPERVRRGRRCR